MTDGRHSVGDAGSLYVLMPARHLRRRNRAGALARSRRHKAAAEKVLLLTGRRGVGKTHLLCDAASRRIEDGLPTILLLGQDFDAGPCWHRSAS